MKEGGNIKSLSYSNLRKLLRIPWWRRVWTFQEAIAAKSGSVICCGNNSFRWEEFSKAAENALRGPLQLDKDPTWFARIQAPLRLSIRHLDHKDDELHFFIPMLYQSKDKFSLRNLLYATHHRQASDPRDHAYANLGLTPKATQTKIYPDYEIPLYKLYQNAMIHIFELSGNLNYLIMAEKPEESGVPSWCCDFSTRPWAHELR